ncbi:MAG: Holliday junction resolvase RuvX, partial [Candidatus Atribacteria bacterium]|nr:Holliday junction resolvase RuvX [Candidatus Atribacteria bacterium]MCD6349909.1 Holliday junction resolvase RuvX [Candidatus Atribacteria bacterium]
PRIMAVDWGTRRVGLAFNRGSSFAFSGGILTGGSIKEAASRVLEKAREERVEIIVLGFPLRLGGEEKKEARLVREFLEELKRGFSGKVVLLDERLTTREAERRLIEADLSRTRRKKIIDQLSAIILLETYLKRYEAKDSP